LTSTKDILQVEATVTVLFEQSETLEAKNGKNFRLLVLKHC